MPNKSYTGMYFFITD